MYLENISLMHFKNYRECQLEFSPQVNCIVGVNGSGKTNLLDAIHYLSLTKSAFNTIDQQNIQHGADFFSIRGIMNKEGKQYQLQCSLKAGGKKIFQKDKKAYQRLSQHVGLFPTVLITPYDTDLIREGSEIRRKFLNNILSQLSTAYLDALLNYQHLLKQRNQLLKDFASGKPYDSLLISSFDKPMLELGKEIFQQRKEFMGHFLDSFQEHYASLSGGNEQVDLVYESHYQSGEFETDFKEALQKDLVLMRTTKGIHKDDLIAKINDRPMRKFGSQGQQKCFVIAMKLAQFEIIREQKGIKPILLLDDIFDKLDDERIGKLMTMVSSQVFGQLFFTDARPERTSRILEVVNGQRRTFRVDQGHALLT